MKKILLTVSVAFTFIAGAFAQGAPDFGFETWNNIPFSTTVQDPQGWASLNALTLVGTPQSTFKETTAPYAGAASCKITTVKVSGASIPNPFRPGKNFDTAGFVGVGVISSVPSPNIKFGYSISGRPSVLSFASKYTPVAGDTAFVFAYLTHWNGTSRDTIAYGKYKSGATTAAYIVNSFLMSYKATFSTVWADTMMVFASSSIYSHDGAKIGSAFYVDGFAWSGYNSINEYTNKGSVSTYPNPATTNITFNSSENAELVEVMDVTGRAIGNYTMTGNKVTVETGGLAPGIYIYNVIDEKNQVINRGKFEVSK